MSVLRRRLGLTQSQLAYVLGYEESMVSAIENGRRMPHIAEVLMMELVFGVPAATIFPTIRASVGKTVRRRLKTVVATSPHGPRESYKTAHIERVLASLDGHHEPVVSA